MESVVPMKRIRLDLSNDSVPESISNNYECFSNGSEALSGENVEICVH